MKTGDLAFNFNLADQDNNFHSLSDFKGKWVLLYFYPKDNTPGCTKEACTIQDNLKSFEKINAQVLGLSADSVESHKKFVNKFNLNFPLLSDPNKKVLKEYNALATKKIFGKEVKGIKRMSYLIDPDGRIAKIYSKVKPETHAKEVLEDLNKLK